MDERLTQETLSNLVTQFSSAWDYLRELVQNSIDAGSNHIEVWTEFQPGPDDNPQEGVIAIHVDDFGAGMTEAIIDDQLTQLFSSAKENDLTKIGKFGIGFVSVFALQPAGVLVHTGRGGEFWEVFFHADLSFSKTRIENPVEGTQITSFLAGDHARYAEVVDAVHSTLSKWCAHSDTEINFEDRGPQGSGVPVRINEAFEVSGEFCCHTEQGELEMVMAYSRRPVYGFYNRGLALAVGGDADEMLGGHADRFRHIAFKIKSPWIEHTLSRETVMKDEHFEQAMTELAAVASTRMRQAAIEALCALVRKATWDLDERGDYLRWLSYLLREPEAFLRDESVAGTPMLRTVDGRAASLEDAWESFADDGFIYVAPEPSKLTHALWQRRVPVFLVGRRERDSPVRALLGRYTKARRDRRIGVRLIKKIGIEEIFRRRNVELVDPHQVLCAVQHGVMGTPLVQAMVERAQQALRVMGRRYGGVHIGEITSGGGHEPLFVIAKSVAPVMARPIEAEYVRGRWERPHVVVDHRHPHIEELVELAVLDTHLAVFCLCRALLLHEHEMAPNDGELMHAVQRVLSDDPLAHVVEHR